jgi:hypothetical protein
MCCLTRAFLFGGVPDVSIIPTIVSAVVVFTDLTTLCTRLTDPILLVHIVAGVSLAFLVAGVPLNMVTTAEDTFG